MNEDYIKYVKSKSKLRYLAGLLIRWKNYISFQKRVKKARKKGATIGDGALSQKELFLMLTQILLLGATRRLIMPIWIPGTQ